jgi:hypothetical protein
MGTVPVLMPALLLLALLGGGAKNYCCHAARFGGGMIDSENSAGGPGQLLLSRKWCLDRAVNKEDGILDTADKPKVRGWDWSSCAKMSAVSFTSSIQSNSRTFLIYGIFIPRGK